MRLSEQKRFESSAEGWQRWHRRNLRWQAVPHLRANDWKCLAANSGVLNRMLDEAVTAGTAKSSATWNISNISEWAKVRRYTAVEDLEYQNVNLGPDALRNRQPMKADDCIRDMVTCLYICNFKAMQSMWQLFGGWGYYKSWTFKHNRYE